MIVEKEQITSLPSSDEPPRLAIMMQMVWGVRNVVYSGVLERLVNAGVEVHLLMPEFDPTILDDPEYADFRLAAGCHTLRPLQKIRAVKGRSFLHKVIGSAFSRRNHIGSYAIYRRWFERNNTRSQQIRQQIAEMLGTLAQPSPIFFRLYDWHDRLYKQQYDMEPARVQLQKINPDLIWSTVNITNGYDRVYVQVARELGIPLVNSINSFDNLTSKAAHLIYDYYMVWNRGMQDQLLRFYPQIKGEQVKVTGTPQFDFHCRQDCHWSREETLNSLKLPDDAVYFLYTTGHWSLVPEEPKLVSLLARRMAQDHDLQRYRLVVRTHPLDDWSRWTTALDGFEHVVLQNAWTSRPNAKGWALPTFADQARYISTMSQAAACINIASTTTLDAAILDSPVIGIRFEHEVDAPQEMMYDEYDTDHYAPLVISGGVSIARTWEELFMHMHKALSMPQKNQMERSSMIKQECGHVDGRGAERVSLELQSLLSGNKDIVCTYN